MSDIIFSKNFKLSDFTKSKIAKDYKIYNYPDDLQINRLRDLTINVLQPIRDWFLEPVLVTSGFRCPKVNFIAGGEKNSQHLKGEAADIKIEGLPVQAIYNYVIEAKIPHDQMINEYDIWLHISFHHENNRFQHFKRS